MNIEVGHFSRRVLLRAGAALGLYGLGTAGGCASARESQASLPGPVGPLPVPPPSPVRPPVVPSPTIAVDVAIMPRSAWTSTPGPARNTNKPMNGVRRITIHHEGAIWNATDQATVARHLESIRLDHLRRKSKRTGEYWADIGYHYVIDPAGRVWEARSTNWQGAHVDEQNEHNLGIMLMGNFDSQQVSPAALASVQRMVRAQMVRYRVAVSMVYTHQELDSTRCPGTSLQRQMVLMRGSGGALRVA